MDRRLIKQKTLLFIATSLFATLAQAVDVNAVQALISRNNCYKCHDIDNEKDGTPYRVIAEKYRGNAQAETILIKHITSAALVVFPDGHEEEHRIVRTTPADDMAQIRDLVQWILSH